MSPCAQLRKGLSGNSMIPNLPSLVASETPPAERNYCFGFIYNNPPKVIEGGNLYRFLLIFLDF